MSKWFDKLKMFSNHSAFVCGMVLLWMYLEYCIALLIKGESMNPYLIAGIVVFTVLFVLKLSVVNHFKVSPLTIRKMMTNALGFKWLSLLFVLTFTMQLAWFVDATYKLFVDGDSSIVNISQCGLTLFSLIVINLLFPIVDRKKTKIPTDKRTLLVTGFSGNGIIQGKNLDLFLKPFVKKNNSVSYENIKKVVIIVSDTLYNCTLDTTVKNKDNKILWNNYDSAKPIDREKPFREFIQHEVKNIIKRDIEVILSKPVSYDDFDVIYVEVSEQLRKHETNTSQTVVFITPGSATVTSALTPLAIKGKRALLFAAQGIKDMPLKESDIDVFSVEDLLNELWGEYEIDSQK